MDDFENYYINKDMLSSRYNPPENRSFMANFGYQFMDLLQTLVIFIAIFTLIYLFLVQPHKVSGKSMYPTLDDGDYILTDKISYRFGSPIKGDIIVFKNPNDKSQDFVKRIIATPGDAVEVNNGHVFVNNHQINEPYLPRGTIVRPGSVLQDGEVINIANNRYLVFGDNRDHSFDSRDFSEITIPGSDIVGKVFFRYWPLSSFGIIKHYPSN